jgi:hypothetical protein
MRIYRPSISLSSSDKAETIVSTPETDVDGETST